MIKKIAYCAIILYLSVFLISCFDKNKRKSLVTFYPSGVLKSKKWFFEEGVFIDTGYYYYENGNPLLIEVRNDSGLLNGTTKFFFENGVVEQIVNYENGSKEGFLYRYTIDGHLDTKNYYSNDKMVGDVFGYNKKGQVNYYGFYDFQERNLNLITYDSITGKPIKNMYQNIFIDSVIFNTGLKNDSVSIQLLISTPPFRRSIVRIDYLSEGGRLIKSDKILAEPYCSIKQKMPDSLYALIFFGSQYDSLTSTTQTQSNKKIR